MVSQTESDSNTITVQIGRIVSNRFRFSRVYTAIIREKQKSTPVEII